MTVVVSLMTKPKPEKELSGLVYGVTKVDMRGDDIVGDEVWYRSPAILGEGALAASVLLYLPFL